MSNPDLKETLRELRKYLALSYEANHRVARRTGITVVTFSCFLSGKRAPQAKTLAKISAFLRREAKRTARRYGIKPISVCHRIWPSPARARPAGSLGFAERPRGPVRALAPLAPGFARPA